MSERVVRAGRYTRLSGDPFPIERRPVLDDEEDDHMLPGDECANCGQDHDGDHISHDCRTRRRRKLSTRQDPKQRRPEMVTPRRLSRTLSTRQRCSLIASRRTTITHRDKILHDNDDAPTSANHLNERVHHHLTQTKRPSSTTQTQALGVTATSKEYLLRLILTNTNSRVSTNPETKAYPTILNY